MKKERWFTIAAFCIFTLVGRIAYRILTPESELETLLTITLPIVLGTIAVYKATSQQ